MHEINAIDIIVVVVVSIFKNPLTHTQEVCELIRHMSKIQVYQIQNGTTYNNKTSTHTHIHSQNVCVE